MRILVFTSLVQGKNSTPAIHIKEVLRALAEDEHVIAIAQPEYGLKEVSGLVVKEIRIPSAFFNCMLITALYEFLLALCSLAIGAWTLRLSGVDIVYCRHGVNSIGAIILCRLFRKPLVTEVNGLISDDANFYSVGRILLIRRLAWLLDMLTFRWASRIIAVTEGIKAAITDSFAVPESRIDVIPNGVNTDLFKPMAQGLARERLGLGEHDKIVCFVGSVFHVIPWPGMIDLIHSAPIVLEKVPEARFLVIGNGPLKDRWQSMVQQLNLENSFIFAGKVPYGLVPTYINASDICVAPFRRMVNLRRGLSPLKLYEYLACGKPVVGSDISGIGDLLESTDTGIAVTPEDATALGNAIVHLLTDERARERLSRNARQVAVANFTWRSSAQRIVSVCTNVLNWTPQMGHDGTDKRISASLYQRS